MYIMSFKSYLKKCTSQILMGRKINIRKFSYSEPDIALKFLDSSHHEKIPTYQISANASSKLLADSSLLIKMYQAMLSVNLMDKLLYECQRQGRISFYMTNFGEEAVQIGSAAALSDKDLVFAQYRESGVLLWRGFTFTDFINQCFGNDKDINKGRQMPVHYGSKELNFFTISSPLTTQLPQAVGAAHKLKTTNTNTCVACYFGEGAASEGDAHAAFNFAATLSYPVIFICRNNAYAISTPSCQQYAGNGIAARGPAFGIKTIRVDGNDILSMYEATKYARKYASENCKPVLIEAMTYRVGHHSTSDDSTIYRDDAEIEKYQQLDPIRSLKSYLKQNKLWDESQNELFIKATNKKIMEAIKVAENYSLPSQDDIFNNVYSTIPFHISKQQVGLQKYLKRRNQLLNGK